MTATLGILGGGQLGRMLALAGIPLGVRCVVLEPSERPPAAACAEVIRAAWDDPGALDELADRCDVVTIEVEHVPVAALRRLADTVPVRPSPSAVATTQDRALEKQAVASLGIPTAPFGPEPSFPALVKARVGGFDGRGQRRVDTSDELVEALHDLGEDSVVEGIVMFDRELSVVAARGVDGSFVAYPVVENRHRDGILRTTLAPASDLSPATREEAIGIARSLAEHLDLVGVIAVEMFDVGGQLVVNEIAPRVHNSGHWTIEGAVTSQFEQHVRAVMGLPLGSAAPRGHSAMVNLIGSAPDDLSQVLAAGAHVHLYGKEPRPGRKVGHLTVNADGPAERDARLALVQPFAAGEGS